MSRLFRDIECTKEQTDLSYSGKAFFPSGITHSSTFLHLFTDASDLGCGFSSNWHQFHITDREFHQIVISLEHWCNQSHN